MDNEQEPARSPPRKQTDLDRIAFRPGLESVEHDPDDPQTLLYRFPDSKTVVTIWRIRRLLVTGGSDEHEIRRAKNTSSRNCKASSKKGLYARTDRDARPENRQQRIRK